RPSGSRRSGCRARPRRSRGRPGRRAVPAAVPSPAAAPACGRSPAARSAAPVRPPPACLRAPPARETERRARSLPASQCFPRDLELVGLATQSPLQLRDPATLLGLQRPVLPRLEPLRRRRQRLLAPLAQQALGDVVLTAELSDRTIATQRRQDDLELLLRRELPVLAVVAQHCSLRLSGPCSRARRTRSAPRPTGSAPNASTPQALSTPYRGAGHGSAPSVANASAAC